MAMSTGILIQSRHVLASLLLLLLADLVTAEKVEEEERRELTVFTVATDPTDGYLRFVRSLDVFELELVTLGEGETWQGGDMSGPAGGWKVNLLKRELEKTDREGYMLFTDSYDVVFAAGKESIFGQYDKMGGGIIFGAESFCWPDASLSTKYPPLPNSVKPSSGGSGERRYLNSGGFMGSIDSVRKLLEAGGDLADTDDDQLFYTRLFLDSGRREQFQMKLDHSATIFQNLHGDSDNMELRFAEGQPYFYNLATETMPMIFHGNGPSKLFLNLIGNYVPGQWNQETGCEDCWRDTRKQLNKDGFVEGGPEVPRVLLAVFIEQPTPFMDEFWEKLVGLAYAKSNIDLVIHNRVDYHAKQVAEFSEYWSSDNNVDKYRSVTTDTADTNNNDEAAARNRALMLCVTLKCDYLFVIDSAAQLDNPHTLSLLIEQNRPVVAPLMIRPYSAWSNYWGLLSSDGYYARSFDYMDIVRNDRRGLWNAPYISSCYLVAGSLIRDKAKTGSVGYTSDTLDPDMAFAQSLRKEGVFMYVSNRVNFGHLVNNENFPVTHLHNELWEMERNRYDWEMRYLHPNYSQSLEPNHEPEEPCPDVYWFPIMTERFCDEFVAEAENYGKWSDGSNTDNRLTGGYEAVPTRDIHMNQMDFDNEWLYILDTYVRPLQESIFTGYFHHPPRSIMNFMVRYRPDEQPSLRPHHDSSTYTINVALNKVNEDYEGGGCRFLRYNCQVTDTKKGHMLMHPGRLTHYHEGLTVTKGTRYIMISFVDP